MNESGQAVVVHPDIFLPNTMHRNPMLRLEEAVGLTQAINLKVAHAQTVHLRKVRPSTLLGGGAVEELKGLISHFKAEVVIVDASLTPVQQRNLEKAWSTKVIDRTGLILEIFGERARTAEGRLQVELAALTYQRSRLVRSWTHLERQRGGFGFTGGPGETQLEVDRRLITDRIVKLKRELEDVKRTRALHRKARQRVPYPIVALVGYTNAGKSTLFNRLTQSNVFAENLLFATLDPTMRRLKLPSGREMILSDTVGFISSLPTQLIAAFRATLEEVCEADLIIHVRDIAHPETEEQAQDVYQVLKDLGLETSIETSMIEALNKIDLLPDQKIMLPALDERHIPISALKGDGIDSLLAFIDRRLAKDHFPYQFSLKSSDGAALAWLYRHGEIEERQDHDEDVDVLVRLSAKDAERFKKEFHYQVLKS
jgi:GTP-binding protein HflX